MLKEFKDFAMRGNVVDLAVGFILGGAFGTIVKSLVNDVLMPPIGLLLGGVDFSNLKIVLKEGNEAADIAEVAISYGLFINNVISFVIVAWALFLIIKAMNTLKKKEEAAPKEPAAPPKQEVLLEEIRDLLAKR
ncbi:large-conductance mechanosensitive channel protein MscL [Oceanibacterium hippocampi]|uniref:Large-conductance mechanosensitive channel n=1 Tax=Oceanibacterium hippocampi TaxID=745714 RepID=A0A1Y5SS64_9PROT|nr:large-conductance mechanosensitive channel protein MscL [Oceanibacterium hippocampi]SLN47256.1 Large-conductance mechanosensitive channel [Oceanibacterium hippocampi]